MQETPTHLQAHFYFLHKAIAERIKKSLQATAPNRVNSYIYPMNVNRFVDNLCGLETVLADSLVLRNPLLRQAPKRYRQTYETILTLN